MEDEDFDNNSPIGQLIQEINKICKKPKIDNELSKALDVFQEKVTNQNTYLHNGIFNINFAEAALFLQSCAQLYGKKVDLFWDQLLEFHTRLIEYDCRDEEEKGKTINTDAIQKLEERRNRYKRKKKFKLALGETNNSLENFLFEKSPNDEKAIAFEADDDIYKVWKRFEHQSAEITRIPKAVYKQQTRMYRMKNYYILKSEDYDIYDPEDGEFNTKYSRIPGWHVIQHIFEYNTLGLLPDKNNTIATLRLCCYLRAQFMRDRNIPFNAPYSQYKDEYLAFKKQFFEEEAKKWQNMPLDTMADLHRQLEYLAQKEREENLKDLAKDPAKKCWDIPPFLHKKACSIEGCSECSEDSKSTIITISDSLDKDHDGILKEDISKTEVYVRLEQLSKDVIDPKLRQDSGFFELDESENLMDGTKETNQNDSTQEISQESNIVTTENNKTTDISTDNPKDAVESDQTNISLDNSKDLSGTQNMLTDQTNDSTETAMETCDETNQNTVENIQSSDNIPLSCENIPVSSENNLSTNTNETTVQNSEQSLAENNNEQFKENINPLGIDDDNFDTRSIMSDHDYCQISDPMNVLIETQRNEQVSKETNNVMVPMNTKSKIITRTVTLKLPKQNKIKISLLGPPPPKRRKISQKQLEKLMTSKINPVKEMKFEKFFSLNYQPQLGEGDVQEIDYDSDNEKGPEEIPAPSQMHDNDDVRSIMSDHSYCQLPDLHEQLVNDSGFIDEVNDQSVDIESREENSNQNNNEVNPNESGIDEELNPDLSSPPHRRREVDPEHEEEYQRLLAQMRESRRELCEELRIDPEREKTERQRKEEERLAIKARVQQWKDKINPILKNLKENDFDIHEYGGRVMEGIEIGENKPFKSIVDGKSSAEVVRFFIASLQLANTYNIEICGAKRAELSNDTFEVKLLKRDRYHEHLTEYHAPSEETFREKLKRIRELQSTEEMEEQTQHPSVKRPCIDKTYKKKKQKSLNANSTNKATSSSSDLTESPRSSISKHSKSSSNHPPNPIKGKNIVVRLLPVVQSTDPNTPSTSRSSFMVSSPINAEDFCEELASVQSRSPELFSTPHRQNKSTETPHVSNVRSLDFQ